MDAPPDPADSAFPGSSVADEVPTAWGAILTCLAQGLEAPIAGLRAGLDGLAAEPTFGRSAEIQAQIDLMQELGRSISKLNQDYFDLAAVDSGAIWPKPRPTRLSSLFDQIDAKFAPLAAQRKLGWSCQTDLQEPIVATDPAWCRRLIACLVDNALRFTPEGGRVKLLGRSDTQGWSLWVSDNGPGFPSGLRARLAKPQPPAQAKWIERADEQLRLEGLGLPLVMALVPRLGGHCTLNNKPNGGAIAAVHFAAEARLSDS